MLPCGLVYCQISLSWKEKWGEFSGNSNNNKFCPEAESLTD